MRRTDVHYLSPSKTVHLIGLSINFGAWPCTVSLEEVESVPATLVATKATWAWCMLSGTSWKTIECVMGFINSMVTESDCSTGSSFSFQTTSAGGKALTFVLNSMIPPIGAFASLNF